MYYLTAGILVFGVTGHDRDIFRGGTQRVFALWKLIELGVLVSRKINFGRLI
jgi:hypothetical protein